MCIHRCLQVTKLLQRHQLNLSSNSCEVASTSELVQMQLKFLRTFLLEEETFIWQGKKKLGEVNYLHVFVVSLTKNKKIFKKESQNCNKIFSTLRALLRWVLFLERESILKNSNNKREIVPPGMWYRGFSSLFLLL